LNYPIRLNNKLAALGGEVDGGDFKPTSQVKAVQQEINLKIDEQLQSLKKVFVEKIPKFNEMVKQKQINPVPFPKYFRHSQVFRAKKGANALSLLITNFGRGNNTGSGLELEETQRRRSRLPSCRSPLHF